MKTPKIDVQDIAAIESAAAALQVDVRQAQDRAEVTEKSNEFGDLIKKKRRSA